MSIDAEFQILQEINELEDALVDAKESGNHAVRRALKKALHELHERRRELQKE